MQENKNDLNDTNKRQIKLHAGINFSNLACMKVLMVCLGNICRSPMAEGILRAKAEHEGVEIEIDSAGTGNYHVGQGPDPRAVACALARGIEISQLRARQIMREDFDRYDVIYVMDRSNLSDVLELAQNAAHRKKVRLILNETSPGHDREVPDPYFGGQEGFDTVFEMLSASAEMIVKKEKQDK